MDLVSNLAFFASPPVYGLTDAARALGVSVSYVQKLRAAGVARPTVPIGTTGRLIYSHDDIRAIAAAIGRDLDHDHPQEAA
jgi:hypothetical protein